MKEFYFYSVVLACVLVFILTFEASLYFGSFALAAVSVFSFLAALILTAFAESILKN